MLKEALSKLQRELKAPKNQRNNFGKYNYRSCASILEAVKPLLKSMSNDLIIIINDDIVNIGERYYIKSTATIKNSKGSISVTAFAREPNNKKGMDESQITGAASSYARKYALNGLLLIDDNKDADSMDNTEVQRNNDRTSQIKKGLESAENIENLKALYSNLDDVEQAQWKLEFSKKKNQLEGVK